MLKHIKSWLIILTIQIQKWIDYLHRVLLGIPTLQRSQISANLFLGGQYNLRGLKKLKQMGITAIVSMREDSSFKEAQFDGIKFLHLPTVDNTAPKVEDLIKGADFIDHEIKNNGKVYIHCRQGLGRGPSMAIAYLIKLGTTYNDAHALVKNVRTFIKLRPSQTARLKEIEELYNSSKQD